MWPECRRGGQTCDHQWGTDRQRISVRRTTPAVLCYLRRLAAAGTHPPETNKQSHTHTYRFSSGCEEVGNHNAGAAPAYLADDCHLLSDAGRRPLRSHSNDIRKLLVPRTHNKLGDRSFSAAGPRLWNDLPPGLRRPGLSFDSFRRSLKTHLFGNWSA